MKPYRAFSLCLTVLWVLLAIAACDSQSPGPTPPTPSPSTTSLSGQVFELTPAGRFPLADVMVSAVVISGLYAHVTTTTGADGRYAFSQLPPGPAVVQAHSAGLRQVCGALIALTANTLQDLEVTSTANPQRSTNPAPLRVTGQIYENRPAGRVGLGGAVIYIDYANDGPFLTVVADADGNYLACGIPSNRQMAFEVARNLSAGYDGDYEIPRIWYQFGADATRDLELKRRQ
jgi:hypothetical protein